MPLYLVISNRSGQEVMQKGRCLNPRNHFGEIFPGDIMFPLSASQLMISFFTSKHPSLCLLQLIIVTMPFFAFYFVLVSAIRGGGLVSLLSVVNNDASNKQYPICYLVGIKFLYLPVLL